MTQQIDELMRLADEYANAFVSEMPSRKTALRTALEAALKPGESQAPLAWRWRFPDGYWNDDPFATREECEDDCAGYEGEAHPLYTAAPPAQTPESTVTVSYDLAPAETESAIQKKLIEMGWTPPAQTPPRLTPEQISEIAVNTPPNVHTYGRAIESAARKQWANHSGVNDE